jgi:hypothetical protein
VCRQSGTWMRHQVVDKKWTRTGIVFSTAQQHRACTAIVSVDVRSDGVGAGLWCLYACQQPNGVKRIAVPAAEPQRRQDVGWVIRTSSAVKCRTTCQFCQQLLGQHWV